MKDKITKSGITAAEIVTRSNDPNFYAGLDLLPNPDPILRKLNRSQDVYDAIAADAHVMGERRAIRAGLLSFDHRVVAASDKLADIQATELCKQYMQAQPAPGMRWPDLFWNIAESVLYGMRIHEAVWDNVAGVTLPVKIVDRPNQRFKFDTNNALRILTKSDQTQGIEAEPYRFLITRHMPSAENPYGEALLSSCYWPYTFKHAGFKYFAKFCERFGFPWPIAKYPEGSTPEQIRELNRSVAKMVEAAGGSIPEGNSIELLQNKVSGKLVHQSLIDVCNAEMSKALSLQTLATEIQGQGSRAAAETHRGRELSGHTPIRAIVADTISELFAWITEVNILGATPPRFEFYQDADPRQATVDFLEKANTLVDIPKQYGYDLLQIPMPKAGEDVLPRQSVNTQTEFAQAQPNATDITIPQTEAEVADDLIAALTEDIRTLLNQSKTLKEFRDALVESYADLDETALADHLELALMTGLLTGVDDATEGV